jgi:hypothetical protein
VVEWGQPETENLCHCAVILVSLHETCVFFLLHTYNCYRVCEMKHPLCAVVNSIFESRAIPLKIKVSSILIKLKYHVHQYTSFCWTLHFCVSFFFLFIHCTYLYNCNFFFELKINIKFKSQIGSIIKGRMFDSIFYLAQ